MKLWYRLTLLLAMIPILAACNAGEAINGNGNDPPASPQLRVGSGNFTFTGSPGSRDRPVTVHYHRPSGYKESSPILFVMHGNGRNATSYRSGWIPHANAKDFLLVVPEFSTQHYPSSLQYHQGNIMTSSNAPIDSTYWSFVTIESIFDEVKRRTGSTRDKYFIYGHSAGSQFVHRMLQLMPHARIEEAAVANAGWYTIPTGDINWPYGLKGIPSNMNLNTRLREVFGGKVVVLLGEADTSTTDPDLRTTKEAMVQGIHRLERGHYFYDASKEIAAARGLPFNWILTTVPNVSHSNTDMAAAATAALSW